VIQIIVAEDYEKMRQQTAEVINQNPGIEVIDTTGTGPDLWSSLAEHVPDVLWLSISLLEFNESEAVTQLRADHPKMKIVLHAALNDRPYLRRLLRLEADGYLLKDDTIATYCPAIHQVYEGNTYISEAFTKASREGLVGQELSPRELAVLELLARDIPEEEIAARLCITVPEVAWHVERIRRKLDVHTAAALVIRATELGLVE
jgi:DNA-binding NarL/FixJ family response regulator